MIAQLAALMRRPALYEDGTASLWNDGHISKGMLEAHLDPTRDAATRNHAFVRESVQWIAQLAPAEKYSALLDLGCGPGVYAELFQQAGYRVTGVDLSERSIRYARDAARKKNLSITYRLGDYLTLDDIERYDLVTLIYCDFGVLSTPNRARLLQKIHAALRPGGLLLFDVFTPAQYAGKRTEYKSWEYAEEGFFCAQPHIHLEAQYCYENEKTFCSQHIVMTEDAVKSIHIWEHVFTKNELERDLECAGFTLRGLYGNVCGAAYDKDGKAMCAVARKA